jgi:hypothetical protein
LIGGSKRKIPNLSARRGSKRKISEIYARRRSKRRDVDLVNVGYTDTLRSLPLNASLIWNSASALALMLVPRGLGGPVVPWKWPPTRGVTPIVWVWFVNDIVRRFEFF